MQDLKKTSTPLILGLIGFSFLFLFIIRFIFMSYSNSWTSPKYLDYLFILFFYSAWIFDIAGLIFGMMGLNTENRKYAKVSIILSILGLLEYVLLYSMIAGMFGMRI